jgi:hypothetical protein
MHGEKTFSPFEEESSGTCDWIVPVRTTPIVAFSDNTEIKISSNGKTIFVFFGFFYSRRELEELFPCLVLRLHRMTRPETARDVSCANKTKLMTCKTVNFFGLHIGRKALLCGLGCVPRGGGMLVPVLHARHINLADGAVNKQASFTYAKLQVVQS